MTLNSFNLAQYYSYGGDVNISVTGGATPYSLTGQNPSIGGLTTYSPNETGTSLTLTITNLYDNGLNEISYSANPVASATPEPATVVTAALGIAGAFLAYRRRRAS